jgi:hypothetical protein
MKPDFFTPHYREMATGCQITYLQENLGTVLSSSLAAAQQSNIMVSFDFVSLKSCQAGKLTLYSLASFATMTAPSYFDLIRFQKISLCDLMLCNR